MIEDKFLFEEYLLKDILKNKYLNSLYNKLLKLYCMKLLKIKTKEGFTDKEKFDLLRFADIMSKSTNIKESSILHNNAQTIVVLLNIIYDNEDNVIQYYLGSVLSNLHNYMGLNFNNKEYRNSDFYEHFKELLDKEMYKIPNTENEYFIGKQKNIYDKLSVYDLFSYSAPTSMGKSYLIRKYIKNKVLENERANFVIIVPSKALINEFTSKLIDELGILLQQKKYKVIKSSSSFFETDYNYIMVYTQERFLYHLLKNPQINIKYIFIDEAHKISEQKDRSAYFYKIIKLANERFNNPKFFFSCPNIPNPEIYLKSIDQERYYSPETSERILSTPVNQFKLIICPYKKCAYIYNDLINDFIEINIPNNFDNLLLNVRHIGGDKFNIIYCNSKKSAVNLAKEYASNINSKPNENVLELVNDIKNMIHPDYYLANLLEKSVAYHVSYIPAIIREKIEKLYKNGDINTVFCTSTLLEGVNFPADNLFISLNNNDYLLKENNRSNFKNLIGRVGRIEYNLMGNVIMLADNEEILEKYKDACIKDIPVQELTLNTMLSSVRKNEIVNCLMQGKTILEKKSDSYDKYNFARYIMNALLDDIIDDKVDSLIFKHFNLTKIQYETIKEQFKDKKSTVQEDLFSTSDQIVSLDNAIKSGLTYPEDINYKNIKNFLLKLYNIFNWGKYESLKDIGKIEKLSYYPVVLNQWMRGFGIRNIIIEALKHSEKTKTVYVDNQIVEFTNSIEQKNIVINNILDEIENVLLYKIANYFLKFSERLMKFYSTETLNNDWYEFLLFGTSNHVVIFLQKLGYTRETAVYIYHNLNNNLKINEKEVLINKSIINNKKVGKESGEVFLNFPEYFY
mgnify:FL=1